MEFRDLLLGLVLVWLAAKLAGEGMERIGLEMRRQIPREGWLN